MEKATAGAGDFGHAGVVVDPHLATRPLGEAEGAFPAVDRRRIEANRRIDRADREWPARRGRRRDGRGRAGEIGLRGGITGDVPAANPRLLPANPDDGPGDAGEGGKAVTVEVRGAAPPGDPDVVRARAPEMDGV